jgi:hypothetical protein
MVCAGAGYLLLIPAALPAVLAGCALLGASLPWVIVGIMTLFQRRTPPELMGRADAAFTMAYTVPQTAAIAATAYVGTRRERRRPAAGACYATANDQSMLRP